jgi:hypothetical protein
MRLLASPPSSVVFSPQQSSQTPSVSKSKMKMPNHRTHCHSSVLGCQCGSRIAPGSSSTRAAAIVVAAGKFGRATAVAFAREGADIAGIDICAPVFKGHPRLVIVVIPISSGLISQRSVVPSHPRNQILPRTPSPQRASKPQRQPLENPPFDPSAPQ